MGSRGKLGEFTWAAISRAHGIEGRANLEKLEREEMDERRGWMDRRGRETSEGVVSGDKGYLVVELMREKVG